MRVRVCVLYFIAFLASPGAHADYLRDTALKEFIAGHTIFGRTARDGDKWQAYFDSRSSAVFYKTNGIIGETSWTINIDRIEFNYQGYGSDCTRVYRTYSNSIEWRHCDTDKVRSHIVGRNAGHVAPNYDTEASDQINSLQAIQAIFRAIPVPERGRGAIFVQMFKGLAHGLIDSEIRRVLDEQDQRRHAAALKRAIITRGAASWHDADKGTGEDIEYLGNVGGGNCHRTAASLTFRGETHKRIRETCHFADGSMNTRVVG